MKRELLKKLKIRKQDQVCCMPHPFSKLIQCNDNSSKAPTKTYILMVPFNHLGEKLTVGLSSWIFYIICFPLCRRNLKRFFSMKSVRSVERVVLILSHLLTITSMPCAAYMNHRQRTCGVSVYPPSRYIVSV